MIPVDRWSNSWVVTRKSTGEVIGEFTSRRLVERFNADVVIIETAHEYLCRINAEIRANGVSC